MIDSLECIASFRIDFMRNRCRSWIITNKSVSFRSITHKVYFSPAKIQVSCPEDCTEPICSMFIYARVVVKIAALSGFLFSQRKPRGRTVIDLFAFASVVRTV